MPSMHDYTIRRHQAVTHPLKRGGLTMAGRGSGEAKTVQVKILKSQDTSDSLWKAREILWFGVDLHPFRFILQSFRDLGLQGERNRPLPVTFECMRVHNGFQTNAFIKCFVSLNRYLYRYIHVNTLYLMTVERGDIDVYVIDGSLD